ncbi:peroxiredoxin [Fuerstiella marisgermanici]|nr:peroxiredoxin [Fuerstiella marisgermanici]
MTRCPIITAALLLACANPLWAKNPPVSLREGDAAPVFSGVDDKGNEWNSSDYIGRNVVVVYFYPADMTSVCTRQACSFRDQSEELGQAGIKVVGVSGDSVKNHQLFKKAHSLNFPLLADVDGSIAKAFGVPVRDGGEITRVVDGKQKKLVRGVTARRWTFVIGLDGTIMNRNTDVQAATDGKSVLKLVRHLTASAQ